MANQHPKQASIVTQADIARHCGVRQATVSRVLSGHPYVRDEIRQRVQQAIQELGYDPLAHDTARRLVLRRQGKTLLNRTLAIVIHESQMQYRYYNSVLIGFRQVAEKHGYAVAIVSELLEDDKTTNVPLLIQRGEIDGIAQLSFDGNTAIKKWWADAVKHSLAMCLFYEFSGHSGLPSFAVDLTQGGYLGMQHLLALGHRHILYYTHFPLDQGIVLFRLAGVNQALAEYDLSAEQCLTYLRPQGHWCEPNILTMLADWGNGDESWEKVVVQPRRILLDFLAQHPEITAIAANNDTQAIMLAYALREAGIRVPEEISIIGFDDTDALLDPLGRNLLTTIRLPLVELGRSAARWMIECIEQEKMLPVPPPLPVELIVRHTTAPCPNGHR